jgi:hypothetical protein
MGEERRGRKQHWPHHPRAPRLAPRPSLPNPSAALFHLSPATATRTPTRIATASGITHMQHMTLEKVSASKLIHNNDARNESMAMPLAGGRTGRMRLAVRNNGEERGCELSDRRLKERDRVVGEHIERVWTWALCPIV